MASCKPNENEITEKVIKYQHDLGCKKIRNLFKHRTYFEILKKKYDENTHSAFIAWLLEGADINLPKEDLPIMNFLDLLIEKTQKDKGGKGGGQRFNKDLRHSVLARTIEIDIKEVITEKVIKELSSIEESKDRVDIYVECAVTIEGNKKLLQIFIENKIGSTEGATKKTPTNATQDYKEYCNKYQTERYYWACSEKFRPNTKYAKDYIDRKGCKKNTVNQLFVYLTPSDGVGPKKDKFIHITYQDLYNRVLSPLLMETNLDTTCYSLIKEYALTLTLPPANKLDSRRILAIAIDGEEKNLLQDFWENHKDLIKQAADNAADDNSGTGNPGRNSNTQNAKLLLKKFWEMNSDVIMAACYMRLFDSAITIQDFDEINYYLSNLSAGWDQYMFRYKQKEKYTYSKSLLKRNLVLEIIKALFEKKRLKVNLKQVQPLKWIDNKEIKHDTTYLEKLSDLNMKYQNNLDELDKRYFTDEFDIEGEKYRLSNQWGAGQIFNAFIDKMSELGIEIKQVAVNGTVKWDED